MKKQITYAERLVNEFKQTQNYYNLSKKPVENYKYMGAIIPSMRVIIADVIARCAINYDKQVEVINGKPGQGKLADAFHNWSVEAAIPVAPVMSLYNKYAREIVGARCIMDISKDYPKKNLRPTSPLYSFYLAYSYLMLFFWEAGFIKDDVMSNIMVPVMKAGPKGMLSGEIQKAFLKLVHSWCRTAFPQLKDYPEQDYGIDEKLEETIIKTYFAASSFDYDKIFFELWGDDKYDDFFSCAENLFLIDLINAEEFFIREETSVVNRIHMHIQSEKLLKSIDETKAKLSKATDELAETKKRARQAEKELAAFKAAATDDQKIEKLKSKIDKLTAENNEFKEEAKASKLELELNNHKKAKYAEKIKLLEKDLEEETAEKCKAQNALEEANRLNKELLECLEELDEENNGELEIMSDEDREIIENCRYTLLVPHFIAPHIKRKLPNCRVIVTITDDKFDIGRTDAVFIITNHIKHSQVYRVTSQAEHYGTPVVAVNSTGINNLINQVIKYYKDTNGGIKYA